MSVEGYRNSRITTRCGRGIVRNREFYSDLGRYIEHYATLKRAWDDLKRYLDQECPRMIISLKGCYIEHYATLKRAWDDLKRYLDQECPRMIISLKDGVKEDELNAIEAQIGCKLPQDYRCSFRIHNGQKLVVPGYGYVQSLD
ncbi:UNVERIFIED_CONTAM: hypothetical protein FKN15_032268 [Acipenser sinensis]